MSDSKSKCYDDEIDWANFKSNYGLNNTNWQVYSNEASWAQKAINLGITKTPGIKLFVRQQQELLELQKKHEAENKAFKEFEKLGV